MLASRGGHLEVVQELLQNGAQDDIETVNLLVYLITTSLHITVLLSPL